MHALASMMKPSSFESMRGIPEHYVYTGPASISGENFTVRPVVLIFLSVPLSSRMYADDESF